MSTGIGASLVTFAPNTLAQSSQVNSNCTALNSGGVSNDGGSISTSGTGDITCNSVSNGQGVIRGTFLLATPYDLVTNTAINSGSTNTYTCTGVGGIPSGAKAVWINAFFTGSAIGTFAGFTPHGTSLSMARYPVVGSCQNTSSANYGSFIVPLDSNGQMDVKAFNGNCGTMSIGIFAYII